MRAVLLLIGLVIIFPMPVLAAEEDSPLPAGVVIETVDRERGLKRVFSRVWARLRAYIPRPAVLTPTQSRTQIAGVRGAETTGSRLQPYWKGDKTSDPVFVEETQTFVAAIELVEVGKLEQAAAAFKAFGGAYPDSKLNPNVRFALGLVYAQLGDTEQALTTLEAFAQAYPSHPLADDARQVMQELRAH